MVFKSERQRRAFFAKKRRARLHKPRYRSRQYQRQRQRQRQMIYVVVNNQTGESKTTTSKEEAVRLSSVLGHATVQAVHEGRVLGQAGARASYRGVVFAGKKLVSAGNTTVGETARGVKNLFLKPAVSLPAATTIATK